MINLFGKRVSWVKLDGKQNGVKVGEFGSGVLMALDLGLRMVIGGDLGISTSPVTSIVTSKEQTKNGIELSTKVRTRNSTYLVKELS